jgi:dTDP-glucose pyrophosphorylase
MKYFRIIKKYRDWKGERFFAFDSEQAAVLQIVEKPSTERPGGINMIGVYYISRVTFLTNYHGWYVEECGRTEFTNARDRVIRKLKKH